MANVPVWSVLLVAIGVPLVLWPGRVTRVQGVADSIGRRADRSVGSTDWYITLVRIAGGLILLVGIAGVLGAIT